MWLNFRPDREERSAEADHCGHHWLWWSDQQSWQVKKAHLQVVPFPDSTARNIPAHRMIAAVCALSTITASCYSEPVANQHLFCIFDISELREKNVLFNLTMVDSVGFGDQIDKDDRWELRPACILLITLATCLLSWLLDIYVAYACWFFVAWKNFC